MSTNSHKNTEDQEIDLSLISKNIGGFFQRLNTSLFKAIQFCGKKKMILIPLLILGVGLGLFLDKTQKTYNTEIIVAPNFGSADYLYAKIDLIESKIKENDLVYLKAMGIENPKNISKIEIRPIVDIYKFINRDQNDRNLDLFKLMAEDDDVKKVVNDNSTSKNYPYHLITFITKGVATNDGVTQPILTFLNNNSYFKTIQKSVINNILVKMKANDITINQIDGILNKVTNSAPENGGKSDKLVFYNGDTQLNDVLKTKDELLKEQGNNRISLVDYNKTIKDISITSNIINTESINGNLKFVLPLLFIFIYILGYSFRRFYKKQTLLAQQNKG